MNSVTRAVRSAARGDGAKAMTTSLEAGGYAATVLTTRARMNGSRQRRRVCARRVADHSTHGIATISDRRQSGMCAQPENTRPVKVVDVARRAEYPTIAAGGAGVARAERR